MEKHMTKPVINVTPLIDVLLVLLIIFMVVTPMKPSSFKAKVPSEPTEEKDVPPDPRTLVVVVGNDASLRLNGETGLGAVNDPIKMIERLKRVFAQRTANSELSAAGDGAIQRSVFIKAHSTLDYGSVAKVVDAVKQSGADPIALQIDDLD
jgi:biopolymer transport protein ExbD